MRVCVGFRGFSTVGPPRTAGVTDNPRPPPLSGEPPIGLGAGGKNPGPGGHPGGPLSRRRGPVARGGTRREVLRFRLPYGTPLARHAPPSPSHVHATWEGSVRSGHHWSPKRAQSAPSRRLPLTVGSAGLGSTSRDLSLQLPTGPHLLVHAVPTQEVYAGT